MIKENNLFIKVFFVFLIFLSFLGVGFSETLGGIDDETYITKFIDANEVGSGQFPREITQLFTSPTLENYRKTNDVEVVGPYDIFENMDGKTYEIIILELSNQMKQNSEQSYVDRYDFKFTGDESTYILDVDESKSGEFEVEKQGNWLNPFNNDEELGVFQFSDDGNSRIDKNDDGGIGTSVDELNNGIGDETSWYDPVVDFLSPKEAAAAEVEDPNVYVQNVNLDEGDGYVGTINVGEYKIRKVIDDTNVYYSILKDDKFLGSFDSAMGLNIKDSNFKVYTDSHGKDYLINNFKDSDGENLYFILEDSDIESTSNNVIGVSREIDYNKLSSLTLKSDSHTIYVEKKSSKDKIAIETSVTRSISTNDIKMSGSNFQLNSDKSISNLDGNSLDIKLTSDEYNFLLGKKNLLTDATLYRNDVGILYFVTDNTKIYLDHNTGNNYGIESEISDYNFDSKSFKVVTSATPLTSTDNKQIISNIEIDNNPLSGGEEISYISGDKTIIYTKYDNVEIGNNIISIRCSESIDMECFDDNNNLVVYDSTTNNFHYATGSKSSRYTKVDSAEEARKSTFLIGATITTTDTTTKISEKTHCTNSIGKIISCSDENKDAENKDLSVSEINKLVKSYETEKKTNDDATFDITSLSKNHKLAFCKVYTSSCPYDVSLEINKFKTTGKISGDLSTNKIYMEIFGDQLSINAKKDLFQEALDVENKLESCEEDPECKNKKDLTAELAYLNSADTTGVVNALLNDKEFLGKKDNLQTLKDSLNKKQCGDGILCGLFSQDALEKETTNYWNKIASDGRDASIKTTVDTKTNDRIIEDLEKQIEKYDGEIKSSNNAYSLVIKSLILNVESDDKFKDSSGKVIIVNSPETYTTYFNDRYNLLEEIYSLNEELNAKFEDNPLAIIDKSNYIEKLKTYDKIYGTKLFDGDLTHHLELENLLKLNKDVIENVKLTNIAGGLISFTKKKQEANERASQLKKENLKQNLNYDKNTYNTAHEAYLSCKKKDATCTNDYEKDYDEAVLTYNLAYNDYLKANFIVDATGKLNMALSETCIDGTIDDCINEVEDYSCTTTDVNCDDLKKLVLLGGDVAENKQIVEESYLGMFLNAITNYDQNAKKFANKVFGTQDKLNLLDEDSFLAQSFSSSICKAKVLGYLDKRDDMETGLNSNNGGIARYNGQETILFLKAQRSQVTPDNKFMLTYNTYLKPEIDVKYVIAIKYKDKDTNTYKLKSILNLTSLSANSEKNIYKNTVVENITRNSEDFHIGIVLIEKGSTAGNIKIYHSDFTKILLIDYSAADSYSTAQFYHSEGSSSSSNSESESSSSTPSTPPRPPTTDEVLSTVNLT